MTHLAKKEQHYHPIKVKVKPFIISLGRSLLSVVLILLCS